MFIYSVHVDIDECENDNGMCVDICVDTEGSYTCDCNPGYVQLEGNPFFCQGIYFHKHMQVA